MEHTQVHYIRHSGMVDEKNLLVYAGAIPYSKSGPKEQKTEKGHNAIRFDSDPCIAVLHVARDK